MQAIFEIKVAKINFLLENYENAINYSEEALRLDPLNYQNILLCIESYENISEYSEAIKIIEKYIFEPKLSDKKPEFEILLKRLNSAAKYYKKLPDSFLYRILYTKIDEKEKQLYIEYLDWVKKNGIKAEKVGLQYFNSNYRGMIAKQNIHIDEEIMSVPLESIITLSLSKKHPLIQKILSANLVFNYESTALMAAYILLEMKNPESKFKEALKIFPQDLKNFPCFYNEIELQLLTGSYFVSILIGKIKENYR